LKSLIGVTVILASPAVDDRLRNAVPEEDLRGDGRSPKIALVDERDDFADRA
jgi:hypothetical protein